VGNDDFAAAFFVAGLEAVAGDAVVHAAAFDADGVAALVCEAVFVAVAAAIARAAVGGFAVCFRQGARQAGVARDFVGDEGFGFDGGVTVAAALEASVGLGERAGKFAAVGGFDAFVFDEGAAVGGFDGGGGEGNGGGKKGGDDGNVSPEKALITPLLPALETELNLAHDCLAYGGVTDVQDGVTIYLVVNKRTQEEMYVKVENNKLVVVVKR